MLNPMKTKTYVNMNNFYKQKNEEWLSRHEDYLDMVTSPDFQNLQSPMSEEGVILGPIEDLNTEQYIAFLQSQSEGRPIVDGGYLDVKFALKKREKASEEEEEESPAEVLTSLEKPEESSSKRSSITELSPPSGDTTTVPMN
ncbi:hypothetical protein Avbf_11656 [Armadillidium vulgare]|nr:hypothetical protein Avbf_11656 [Armadillidium vulgare]